MLGELQEFFADGKMVDDLPRLVRLNQEQQPTELVEAIAAKVGSEKGNWYDTHPTDRDRIAVAKKQNARGVFSLDAPAEALFQRFDELSKAAK